jgi:hypothetical protein
MDQPKQLMCVTAAVKIECNLKTETSTHLFTLPQPFENKRCGSDWGIHLNFVDNQTLSSLLQPDGTYRIAAEVSNIY